MRKADLMTLIDTDIDKAFEILDEIFKSNGTYNDLSRQYVDRPIGFSLSDFRSRLKRLVNTQLEEPAPAPAHSPVHEFYPILCKLDFKTQNDLFRAICKNKKIAPFFLYGQGAHEEMEMRWLRNQLLQLLSEEKKSVDQLITIDLGSKIGGAFDRLLDELYTRFEIPEIISDDTDTIALLRENLERRLAAGHVVCFIRNATNILAHPGELKKLCEEFLSFLDKNIVRKNHNHTLIFLFIEDLLPKNFSKEDKYFLWFDKEQGNNKMLEYVAGKDLKIAELAPVENVTEEDIRNWLRWSAQENKDVFKKIKCFIGNEKGILAKGDRPFQVITTICSDLKIPMEDKWIH